MQPDMIYAYVGNISKSYDEKGYLHVKGLASDATLDLDNQRCDPEWLNSAMPQWFKTGNVREMHQLRAVGKATELSKSGTGFEIEAKIVDAQAAEKVKEDIYTGFSIGIKGARVDKSPEALKIAPEGVINGGRIVEVSLVDLPANPSAVLALAKTVGENLVKTEVIDSGEVPCPTCNGTGEVMGDGGSMKECPTCEGTGSDVLDIRPSDNGGNKDDGQIGENASEKAADPDCKTCDGTGKIKDGHVDCPDCVQKTVEGEVEKKDFSDKERSDLADKGQAMPDGSYPIRNVSDLKNAIQSFGRAKNPAAVKKHIIRRARALGKTDLLPEGWNVTKASEPGELVKALEAFSTLTKAGEPGQWKHDPTQLAAVRDGLIAFTIAELGEFKTGDDERWDIEELTMSLNLFLSWWQDESFEGETTSPFGKDADSMSFISLGISPDTVKAATAEDATDDAKTALRDELRKTLGFDELDAIKGASAVLLQEVTDLKEQLADVKTMAAPKGISLRATQFQATRFAEVEQLRAKAAQYRESASIYADAQTKGQFMAEAAKVDAEADNIRKSLEGEN